MRTWILTGSPENFAATRAHDFSVIGLKERRRRQALEIEPGERIVFYLTQRDGLRRERPDRRRALRGPHADLARQGQEARSLPVALPDSSPNGSSPSAAWIPAESLVDELEHIGKWPREHWKLAFQGQLRTVSEADARAARAAPRGRRRGERVSTATPRQRPARPTPGPPVRVAARLARARPASSA